MSRFLVLPNSLIVGINSIWGSYSHEGRVYWFNTVFFTRNDLGRGIYNDPKKLAKRCVLGNKHSRMLKELISMQELPIITSLDAPYLIF